VSYTAPLREPQTGNFDFDIMYSNLTVMNAVQSDRGVYMCTVKTHDGKESSVNIVINIEGKKIKWKTKCNNKIVKRGLSFSLFKLIKVSKTTSVRTQNLILIQFYWTFSIPILQWFL
jgi:hypothetical protein